MRAAASAAPAAAAATAATVTAAPAAVSEGGSRQTTRATVTAAAISGGSSTSTWDSGSDRLMAFETAHGSNYINGASTSSSGGGKSMPPRSIPMPPTSPQPGLWRSPATLSKSDPATTQGMADSSQKFLGLIAEDEKMTAGLAMIRQAFDKRTLQLANEVNQWKQAASNQRQQIYALENENKSLQQRVAELELLSSTQETELAALKAANSTLQDKYNVLKKNATQLESFRKNIVSMVETGATGAFIDPTLSKHNSMLDTELAATSLSPARLSYVASQRKSAVSPQHYPGSNIHYGHPQQIGREEGGVHGSNSAINSAGRTHGEPGENDTSRVSKV
ncbi:hypothetical protein DFJ73DRAFT_480446 [Zopfochytrium polystomum]|nr:hypothetical protein DFJ73DRAFT_480446 [Zopfochytrium polystomum]